MFIKLVSLEKVDVAGVADLQITLLPPTNSNITVMAYN